MAAMVHNVGDALTRHLSRETLTILTKVTITAGSLSLANALFQTLRAAYARFKPSQLARYQHAPALDTESSKNTRAWALVTGASDGLGLAFSKVLAGKGFNVVLHGRNETKLAKVAARIESEYQVSTRTLILDATDYAHSSADYARFDQTVLSVLSDLNLTVLINNVGGVVMVKPSLNKFDQILPAHVDDLINANARFPAQLTRVVIPLLERNQPGLIINVSSGAAIAGAPWNVTYSASKAFNSRFSSGLKTELRAEGKDIECLALEVLFTATPGVDRGEDDLSLLMPSPQTVAKSSLGLVGSGYIAVTPYLPHAVQRNVLLWVAGFSERWLENQMTDMFAATRAHLAKAEKR